MKITPVTPAVYNSPVKPSASSEEATSVSQSSALTQVPLMSKEETFEAIVGMLAYPYWEDRGLTLTQDTKEALFQAFGDANKAMSGHSVTTMSAHINTHQIVMDHQEVPDWFREEKKNTPFDEHFTNGEYIVVLPKETDESIRGFSPASLKAGQLDELMKELYAQNPLSEQA